MERPVCLSLAAVGIVPKVSYEVDGVPISIYEDKKKIPNLSQMFIFFETSHSIKNTADGIFSNIHSQRSLKFSAFFKQYIAFANKI